jgi:pilus assembly protein Flp/PilA
VRETPLGKFLTRFARDESGATAIEYALILAGVFLIAVSAITAFGNNASGVFNRASAAIVAAQ